MSMAGVACILASGITMAVFYIGDWQGLYGTAYRRDGRRQDRACS